MNNRSNQRSLRIIAIDCIVKGIFRHAGLHRTLFQSSQFEHLQLRSQLSSIKISRLLDQTRLSIIIAALLPCNPPL